MRRIKQNELLESIANEVKKTVNSYKKAKMYEALKRSINEVKRNKLNETVDSGVSSDTHFAILKPINKIIFSWDYSGYDNSELREFKKDYFMDDIVDMGFNPKEVKILTKAACLRQGINPEDESCWDNAYEYKVESINRRKTLKEEYGEPVQSDDEEYEDYHSGEAIDFYDFENICHSNGWDWHSHMEVSNGYCRTYNFGSFCVITGKKTFEGKLLYGLGNSCSDVYSSRYCT